MFKDETAVVEKKAKKRYGALALQHPPSTGSRKRGSDVGVARSGVEVCSYGDSVGVRVPGSAAASRYPTPESMAKEMLPSIDDQALGFFISNYVNPPALVPRGQYEWLLEALREPNCDEVLRKSVSAACLAGLANSTKNTGIMLKAQDAYGSALRMTNCALGVEKTAVRDSTLMAVIMLGMYERFVYLDERSIEACAKHVRGASSLLNLRGKEQFRSDVSRRIFHQYYGIILMFSLECGMAVPDGLRELYDHCNPASNYAVQGRQSIRLAQLLHESIDLNQEKDIDSDPLDLINRAIDLDQELDSVTTSMPKIWQFETICLEGPHEHVYGSLYHKYMDPWIAQMWNNVRLCRIHLYRVIRKQIQKAHTSSPPLLSPEEARTQRSAADRVIRSCTAEVCASVPQFTGMVAFPKWPIPKKGKLSGGSQRKTAAPARRRVHPPGTFLDSARPTGMQHLICPLYAAGSSESSSATMRQYAIDMLYYIALRVGTRQAVVLADNLKAMQVPESAHVQRADSALDTTFAV
ncbi:hypothetical protein E8E13_007015 [Curvularia kusanoi]|uniref:Uncharacterized protein n=1 Tax=Curvularia kusanoi TaxID=90978 RepID=A0A9P4TJH0_CURKU|nr:hypothetical protein E8E13_007015 [Curvularia kusanoi]